ncbi:MAG: oligopeptide transporter, partial [Thermoleophilia bacterium]|nr:oligopeptide transporter [Thermoleophilia bacterium]
PIVKHVPEWMRIAGVLVALGWMGISRVVRSQVVSLRGQEFVEAAEALGGSHFRIMTVHILPNCVSVIAVFTTLAVSGAIIAESALSFLGFGVNPPTATWGNMLAEGRDLFTILNYWWVVWFPALAIFITVLSVNFIGDGVRDALDPKTQKK